MKKMVTMGVLLCLSLFPMFAQAPKAVRVHSGSGLEYALFVEPAKWYVQAAEPGNTLAQVVQRYLNGEGVHQDYRELAKRVSIAAEGGDQWAELMLGLVYAAGCGVQSDLVLAHMWSNLAAAGSDETIATMAREQREVLAAGMSSRQIASAQRLARDHSRQPSEELAESSHRRGLFHWAKAVR